MTNFIPREPSKSIIMPATALPKIPQTTTLFNSLRFVKNPIPILLNYHKTYGDTFFFHLGGIQPSIVSVDPVLIQHVLQKNHRNYIKSEIATEKAGRFIGNGLLTSNGDYWLRQRRLIQPGFHRQRLANLVAIMNEVIEEQIELLRHEVKKGKPLELSSWMMRITFRIVARSLFTSNIDEATLTRLDQIISTLQEFIIKIVRQPYLNPIFHLNGAYRKHDALAEESRQILLDIIRARMRGSSPKDDLLQMLLDARYEDTGAPMTEEQLLDECLILFLAGHETTANALTWGLYLLEGNPKIQDKIRQELENHVGDHQIGFNDIPKLTYLLNVIQETMRMYPPAWITDRTAIEADSIAGIDIPKGMLVVLFLYGIHHHSKYWDTPEIFQPDRFDEKPITYSYLPFGGGPRMCIGNNFALMEMQLVLASILRNFNFKLVPNQDIWPRPLVTLRPANGIWMDVSY